MEEEIVYCVSCEKEAKFDLYDEELCMECLIDRLEDTRYKEFEITRLNNFNMTKDIKDGYNSR